MKSVPFPPYAQLEELLPFILVLPLHLPLESDVAATMARIHQETSIGLHRENKLNKLFAEWSTIPNNTILEDKYKSPDQKNT